jgi:hypothetical protein
MTVTAKFGAILALSLLAQQGSNVKAAQVLAPSDIHLYGPAHDSCGKWTAGSPVTFDPGSLGTGNRFPYLIWVEGFVTGTGMTLGSGMNIELAETDPEGIQGWITKYCTDHPLDTLLTASVALVGELRTRAAKR